MGQTATGTGPAAQADGTQDIVVTAQRREQRLLDVPVAVTVVAGASLQRGALTSLEDMAARLPNVKITSGTIVNSLAIRGVASGTNAGFEQSVATFVDGIYRNRSRSTRAALFDIERVEVLKGPQTTFFGANAIAGALNIVTRKPSGKFDYNGSAYYVPSTGEYDGQFGLDVPLDENLAGRVAVRVAGSDGYVKNDITGQDGPHDRSVQGRLSLRWTPQSGFRSDLRIDGGRSRNRNAFPFQLVGCPPSSTFILSPVDTCGRYLAQNGGQVEDKLDYHTTSGRNYANYDFVEAALTNSLDIGSGSLNAITGYFWHKFGSVSQAIPFPLTDSIGSNAFPSYQGERYRQFSQEIRYQSQAGGTLEYMIGGYAAWGNLDYANIVGFRFLPFGAFNPTGTTNAATPVSGGLDIDQKDRTLSAFASATIRPADGLRVNLGARYSSIRKDASRLATFGQADDDVSPGSYQRFDPVTEAVMGAIIGANPNQFAVTRRTDNKFMPSISIQYDLAQDVMMYASYANGFKAGGFGTGSNADMFGPEGVNSYELGLKGLFFDRRLTLDMAVYRGDYKNLQETSLVLLSSGAVTSLTQNAARSRSQGVDFNASLRAAPWLTLTTSVAYLDAKYRDYRNGACTMVGIYLSPTCVQDLSGKRRSFAPEWSGNIGARITTPIGETHRLTIDPLLYFSSRFFVTATADPMLEQRGYSKVDLRIGFGPNDGRWEVALIGKNLTDRATAQFRQPVVLGAGSVNALVDPPRTVGVQFTIKR